MLGSRAVHQAKTGADERDRGIVAAAIGAARIETRVQPAAAAQRSPALAALENVLAPIQRVSREVANALGRFIYCEFPNWSEPRPAFQA